MVTGMETQLHETKSTALFPGASAEPMTAERQHIVACVRKWAGSAAAAVLDPACTLFTTLNSDGLIAYRIELRCAVVFGDPVCPPAAMPRLVSAFHAYCHELGLNVVYINATQQFTTWAMQHVCQASVAFGHEIILAPQSDPRSLTGANASLLRRKVRHALHKGTLVKEYLTPDIKLEQQLEAVGTAWLKSRHGPQIFISHIRLFSDRLGKRWFYARHGDKIVGVLVLNQMQTFHGWLLNSLMMTPDAPHGTPELLVTTAIDTLRNEGCRHLSCGSVPAKQLGEIVGPGSISAWLLRQAFKGATTIFRLNGRMKFWEKFQPACRPSYVLFSQSRIHLREIWALMRALNVGL